MPLSVADRLHLLPHGAQAAVAEKFDLARSYVSAVMRGEMHPKTEEGRTTVRAVQQALAAKYEPPLPVWEVFEEWDGEKPETQTQQEAPPATAKAS